MFLWWTFMSWRTHWFWSNQNTEYDAVTRWHANACFQIEMPRMIEIDIFDKTIMESYTAQIPARTWNGRGRTHPRYPLERPRCTSRKNWLGKRLHLIRCVAKSSKICKLLSPSNRSACAHGTCMVFPPPERINLWCVLKPHRTCQFAIRGSTHRRSRTPSSASVHVQFTLAKERA